MTDPTDPDVTAARDASVSGASSADETAPAAGGRPKFAPPTVAGDVGTLGPYRVVKQLGAGGMGCVYLAIDTRLDRKLALKVMLPEFAANREAKERFLREAKAAAKVSHDNVVTVYEADERDGTPYIAMQFLQGYPLDEYLKNKGVPALAHIARIGREAALGLAAAHAEGLIHRDIKPGNIWLEAPNGRVKVLDFGLAKPVGSESELTTTGAVVGTPAYMSPEQARGLKVDARTDLFSLGALLYRLVTGRTPFAGPNVMAVLMALGSDDPTPVRELNPNVPPSLADLIHQLLAKKPEQRPQTAAEVAKRLRGVIDGLLNPGPAVVGPVPTPSAADLSVSQPVVVHALPVQPNVAPMEVTAQPESVFAGLGAADEATHAEAADEPEAERKSAVRAPRKGGKGVLIGAAVAALVAVGVVAAVVSQMGKKGDSEGAKAPDVPADASKGAKGTPPKPPAAKPTDLPPLPPFEWKPIPVGESPFDKLDAAAIPKEERFDWQPPELVAVIGTHERRYWGEVAQLDFSPDGKWLVYAGVETHAPGDSIVRVIDRATNRTTFTHRLPNLNGIQFAPNGRSLLVNSNNTLFAADFAGGTWEAKPLAPKDELGWAQPILAPDRKTLLIRLGDERYQVWDATADGYALRKPLAHKGACIGFTADGSAAYLEKQDAPGQPWVVERVSLAKGDDTAAAVLTFPPTDGPFWNGGNIITKVSPDGTRLVTCEKGGDSKTCVLYDLTQTPAKEVARFECGQYGPIAFSPDGKTLYRGNERADLTANPPRKLEPLAVGGRFALSPDSKTVAVATGGTILLYDVTGPKPVRVSPLPLPLATTTPYSVTPIAVAGRRGLLGMTAYRNAETDGQGAFANPVAQFWDLTGAKPVPWPDEARSAVGVPGIGLGPPLRGLTPDGAFAAVHTDTYKVSRAKAGPTGFALLDEPGPQYASVGLASDDGFVLASPANEGGPWRLWDLREPLEKARPLPETAGKGIAGATYHAGRGLLVTDFGIDARETTLWKLVGDRMVAVEVFPQHLPWLRLSADGRWLVGVPFGGGAVRLFDLAGARPKPGPDLGDLGRVAAAAFSADARVLFTCNYAGDLRGHDLASGREVWRAKLPGMAAWLYAAPDGRHLLTHNSNGTVYVLRLGDLTGAADRKAAEWVLSVGGKVSLAGQDGSLTNPKELPAGAFSLSRVELSDRATDADLARFKGLAGLHVLHLGRSPVTDAGFAHLAGSTTLISLEWVNVPITGDGLAHLARNRDLQSIQFYGTPLTDAGLAHLKGMAKLTHANLSGTKLTDASAAVFESWLVLGHLNLCDTAVTDATLDRLSKSSALHTLLLVKTKVTKAGVEKLARALPKCKIEWDGGVIEPTQK